MKRFIMDKLIEWKNSDSRKPLEVKSSLNINHNSLTKFNEINNNEISFIFSLNNLKRDGKVINIPLFEKVGIDIAVSPKNSAINEVKNDLQENDVDILATVEQGQGEVLEINLAPDFNGKKIMELKFPAGAIIGVIIRKNNIIIPKGDTVINTNDILIIFTTAENATKIKEFFKVK